MEWYWILLRIIVIANAKQSEQIEVSNLEDIETNSSVFQNDNSNAPINQTYLPGVIGRNGVMINTLNTNV